MEILEILLDLKIWKGTSMTQTIKPFDSTYDYNKDLKDEEFKIEKGKPFVYLKGLERLAKERGIISAKVEDLDFVEKDGNILGVVCTYEYVFIDGRTYHGSADATTKNCEGTFKLYLTAMAESRAKARALRTAFCISTCSVEEKADIDIAETPLGPIGDEQIQLIKILAGNLNISKQDIIELLEIPRKISDIKELTKEEGIEIIASLNRGGKPKKTRARK